MFSKIDECQDQDQAKGHGEANTNARARRDWPDGFVAVRHVDKGAVGMYKLWGVRLEGQDAPGTVGEGPVGVERVIPVVETREVQVDAAD